MNATTNNATVCQHNWKYDYQIISSIKGATFNIYKCEGCSSYKMKRIDRNTKDVTISFHNKSPKDSKYFENLGGYEPYEYFEMDKVDYSDKQKLCKHCLEPPMYCTCIEEIIKETS